MSYNIYEAISLYEFAITATLGIFAIVSRNSFLGALILFLTAKQVPEKIIKYSTKNSKISIRPKEATNCDMINSGGYAADRPGFPSGHSMVAGFFGAYIIHEYIKIKKEKGVELNELLIVFCLFAILVPYARTKLKCHTEIQVLLGCLLGIIWAGLFILLEQKWLNNYERYRNDKKRIIDYFISGYN
jgi:membrane-associated phospholipid phosphatase